MSALKTSDTALVLFSGGQDSTVCLAWALERFPRVETVGFDYGQRHRVELDMRPHLRSEIRLLKAEWGARLGEDHLVTLDALRDEWYAAVFSRGADQTVTAIRPMVLVAKSEVAELAKAVGATVFGAAAGSAAVRLPAGRPRNMPATRTPAAPTRHCAHSRAMRGAAECAAKPWRAACSRVR